MNTQRLLVFKLNTTVGLLGLERLMTVTNTVVKNASLNFRNRRVGNLCNNGLDNLITSDSNLMNELIRTRGLSRE